MIGRAATMLLFSLFTSCSFGQEIAPEIRLRLLDAWSGKPITGQSVTLIGATGDIGSGLPVKDIQQEIDSNTDKDGIARFRLAVPMPNRILFTFHSGRGCPIKDSHYKNQWRPEEILGRGVVVPNWCEGRRWHNKSRWQNVTAKPGENTAEQRPERAPSQEGLKSCPMLKQRKVSYPRCGNCWSGLVFAQPGHHCCCMVRWNAHSLPCKPRMLCFPAALLCWSANQRTGPSLQRIGYNFSRRASRLLASQNWPSNLIRPPLTPPIHVQYSSQC